MKWLHTCLTTLNGYNFTHSVLGGVILSVKGINKVKKTYEEKKPSMMMSDGCWWWR